MIYLKKLLALMICAVVAVVCCVVPAAAEGYLIGDADGDGEVTIYDVTVIQRVLVKMDQPGPDFAIVADVDLDHAVTAMDTTLIQRYLLQIIDSLPVVPKTSDETEAPTQVPTSAPTDADGWTVIIYRP